MVYLRLRVWNLGAVRIHGSQNVPGVPYSVILLTSP